METHRDSPVADAPVAKTNSRSQSPTTYRAMSSSSPTARLSPGLSYASAVTGSPNNVKATELVDASPAPPPPTPASQNASSRDNQPLESTVADETGWKVVSHKKKGKATAVANTRPNANSSRSNNARRAVLDNNQMDLDSPNSEPRKRRRTEDDLGNEDSDAIIAKVQNAPPRAEQPTSMTPLDVSPSPLTSASTNDRRGVAAGKRPSHTNVTVAGSDVDIEFAIAPDSEVVETLLVPSTSSSRSGNVASSSRKGNVAPSSRSGNTAASSHNGNAASSSRNNAASSSLHSKEASSSRRQMRAASFSSDSDDQSSSLADILPLFPLPPSSIPASTPRTPARQSNRRPDTPIVPPRGHHWSDVSNGSTIREESSTYSERSPSIPEVEMIDATRPATPPPTSSHARRRRRRRAERAARSASRNSRSTDDSVLDGPPVPFNIDELDPDIIIPPPGSWRPVQGDSASWKGRGMATPQWESWDALDREEAVLAIQIPFHGAEEPGVNVRIDMMLNVLRRLLLIPSAYILPGYSPAGYHGMNVEPFWYLGRGIPLTVIVALVTMGWFNSSIITLHFDFWRDNNPHLCAMFRLIHRFGAQSKAEYEELVRRELVDSELYDVIYEVLKRDMERGGMWRNSRRVDALNRVLESVDVDVINCRITANTTEPVAVIYMKPPTADRRDWQRFSNQLKKHRFGSNIAGHPEPFTSRVWCGYCHSLGHTAGTCRVRNTPGWHDAPLPPAIQPPQQQYNATNGGGRGRGNGCGRGRGNGRGRGGNGRGGGNF
ncbi:uncharacterized protein C8Q71DRAFT_727152 [Rhodofomes roseus]|uniref:Uncharacterized protein n=1 Tax=Rhodofomes roseus TaxID=34475 RepID=A0ABQ8K2G4_9APHY|nr:uncharacterized protein C8Q71DRAFT_727152 [Rhodofomes roseus]KAH9830959.1 hypothetical protein C8Q71DRAFT_727152 [Rhodofomes roseus]